MANRPPNPVSDATISGIDLQTLASLVSQQINQTQSPRTRASSIVDPTSPYYLHPGESPGSPLISMVLGSNNYHSWERAMLRALSSKNKIKFVNESISKPEPTDPLFEVWERCNDYVISWITLSLSPDIAQSVMWHNVTSDLWKDLKHRYFQGDVFKVAGLEEEMFTLSTAPYQPSTQGGRGRGRGGRTAGRGRGRTKVCTYCGKTGHLIDTCYKKHGLPPHLKQESSAINNAITDDENFARIGDDQLVEDSGTELEFTREQKHALLALLKQSSLDTHKPQHAINQIVTLPSHQGIAHTMSVSTFKPSSWVIDSGASDHVAYCLESFHSLHKIEPILVRMPDGTNTVTSTAGTIIFSKTFFLTKVLYIPSFKFNLISVSKTTNLLKCEFFFDEKCYKIQDCLSLKMIGVAEQRKGLYAFEDLKPIRNFQLRPAIAVAFFTPQTQHLSNSNKLHDNKNRSTSNLWHLRLGHLPNDRILNSELSQKCHASSTQLSDPLLFDTIPFNAPSTHSASHYHSITNPDTAPQGQVANSPQISAPNIPYNQQDTAAPYIPQNVGPIVERPHRERKRPSYLKDYHCFLTTSSTTPPTSSRYPLSHVLSYHGLSENKRKFSIALITNTDPKTYEEAVMYPCWQEAIKSKLAALDENRTWSLTTLPAGKLAIGCKCVFKTKLKVDGSVERCKARLVAKGFTQIPGQDYSDTFSPIVKMNTLRILLAVTAAKDWFIHQLDVNTSFLHGDLEEKVYMKPPPGLNVSNPKLICKLEKSLYGLKQASRQFTAVIVYVDDLVLAGNCIKEITPLKQHLHDLFKFKDTGELKFFLGFEFARSKRGITMYQRKYCLDLLEEYGMLGSRSCSTPMDYISHLSKEFGDPMPNASEYRRLLGRLLYLTNTRPEISFVVGKLSEFLDCPTNKRFQAALRVLKYLKSAPAQGLLFKTKSDLQLTGFSDSDWATCPDTRRSISGYCFFLGTTLITWKSKKQVTVACSFAEAEYRALAASTCEAQWIVFIL
ncbi:uncharacterized protein [Arachis hypogaea]|uniref:uncharacterized protein n=1 Tax=Arachis hypogaea TaxID=3818 RepID=UPI003B217FB2